MSIRLIIIIFLILAVGKYPPLKKQVYLHLTKYCLSVMFLDHTTHFLCSTIRLRPSSFFLCLASSERPKDQKSNDVVKPFFNRNNSFNLKNEHSNRIEKNRNIFYSILCILLIQGDKNLLCLQQKEKTRCGNASRITSVRQSGEERFFYNRRGNVHLRRSSLSSQDPSTVTFLKSCINPSDAGLQ